MRVDTVGKSSFHNKKNLDTLFPCRLLSRVLNSTKKSEPFYHVGSEWTNVCFKSLCSPQGLLLGTHVTLRAPWSWSEQCQISPQERSPLIGSPQNQRLLERQQNFSSSKGPLCTNALPPTVDVNYSSVTWPLFMTLILCFPCMPQGAW